MFRSLVRVIFAVTLIGSWPSGYLWAESPSCSPVAKPVYYTVVEGDSLSEILDFFALNPLWCSNCSIASSAEASHLSDPDHVQAGTTILVPFHCEEQTQGFVLRDVGDHREIRRSRIGDGNVDKQTGEPTPQIKGPPRNLGPRDSLSFVGTYGFDRIDSTSSVDNTQATLLSNTELGGLVNWAHRWSEKLTTNASFEIRSVSMGTVSYGSVANGSSTPMNIGLGLAYGGEKVRGLFLLRQDQDLYFHPTGAGVIAIDVNSISKYGLGLDVRFFQQDRLTVRGQAAVLENLPSTASSYSISSAATAFGGVFFQRQYTGYRLNLNLLYKSESQITSISSGTDKNIQAQFGVEFSFGQPLLVP